MSPLHVFGEYVRAAYLKTLSVKLGDAVSEESPAWVLVDEMQYVIVVKNRASNVGALIDPEIGLLAFVIDYRGGDLQAEFSRALAVSSQLLATRADESRDPNGSWRVALIWLVDMTFEPEWRNCIADRRGRSGVTEELLVDVVFYNDSADLLGALQRNASPWLLLNFRGLLGRSEADMASWSSANADVLAELERLPERLDNLADRELANRVLTRAHHRNRLISTQRVESAAPRRLETLGLKNFRNWESLELDLRSAGTHATEVNVVFGPNGSGKSSIVEAIAIGVTGYSKAMKDFSEDGDQSQGLSYSQNVLKRVGATGEPEVHLNGQLMNTGANSDPGTALQAIDGSILTQEKAIEFVHMGGSQLAADALRDYSDVADDVLDYVEQESKAATERKDRLLRNLGERVTITRIETILERIARSAIAAEFPQEPQQLIRWLSSFTHLQHEYDGRAVQLTQEGIALVSHEARLELEKRLAQLMNPLDQEGILRVVSEWFRRWQGFSSEVAKFFEDLVAESGDWNEWVDARVIEVKTWSESLRNQSSEREGTKATPEVTREALRKRDTLQKELDEVVAAGKDVRGRLSHLEQAAVFLREWSARHPKECPTCATVHEEGIAATFEAVLEQTRAKRQELLAAFEQRKSDVDAIQKLLVQIGASSTPLLQAQEVALKELLRKRFVGEQLPAALRRVEGADEVMQLFMNLRVLPSIPVTDRDVHQFADAVTRKIEGLTVEALQAIEMPQRWSSISQLVRKKCEQVLMGKLPVTLQAAWLEVVWTLTPARWIVAAEPSIELTTQRRSKKLNVTAHASDRTVLAKYFFNLSECQILGLSWFFMRYVTYGRFKNYFIVLDDPAQEMDETTFSALVRFLGGLSRLHRVRKIPLMLLVLMHQEERALELARAADAMVHILRWSKVQGSQGAAPLKRLRLLQQGIGTPSIVNVFRETAVA